MLCLSPLAWGLGCSAAGPTAGRGSMGLGLLGAVLAAHVLHSPPHVSPTGPIHWDTAQCQPSERRVISNKGLSHSGGLVCSLPGRRLHISSEP